MCKANQEKREQPIRQNEQFEIIGQRGNRFEVILRDGKKTVITIPAKEDDE